MKCPNCGLVQSPVATRCKSCGYDLKAAAKSAGPKFASSAKRSRSQGSLFGIIAVIVAALVLASLASSKKKTSVSENSPASIPGSNDELTGGFGETTSDLDVVHAHKLDPEARSLYLKGRRAAKLGQWELAVDTYDAAIQLQPDLTDAHFSRGAAKQNWAFALIRDGEEAEALRISREATKDKKHSLELAESRGWYLMDNDKMEPYVRMTRKAIELDAQINKTDEALLRSLRVAVRNQDADQAAEVMPPEDKG